MDETNVEREGARERLARQGMSGLSDADLLSLLLCTGTRESPVSVLAEELLVRHGGLVGLTRVGAGELAAMAGIGPSKAARVLAAIEIGRRVGFSPLRAGARVGSSADVYRAFAAEVADEPQECFWVLAVDSRQRIKARALISRGSLTACPVAPADVFRPLIREAARAAILVHNHPSGEPEPSLEDERITEALVAAGELLGIRVLDHIIVGRGSYFSFLDAGRLELVRN